MEQQLHAGKSALELSNAGDSADGVEHIRAYALDVLPLRNGKDQPVGTGQGRLDCPQRGGPAGTNRSGDAGKQHNLSEEEGRAGSVVQPFRVLLTKPHSGRNDSPTEIQATVCTDHARTGAKWYRNLVVGTIKPIDSTPRFPYRLLGGDPSHPVRRSRRIHCQFGPEGRAGASECFPAAEGLLPSQPSFPPPIHRFGCRSPMEHRYLFAMPEL